MGEAVEISPLLDVRVFRHDELVNDRLAGRGP